MAGEQNNINLDNFENILRDISERIYKTLGNSYTECVYQKALAYELRSKGFFVQTEYHVPVYYSSLDGKEIQVGDMRIDLYVNNEIIIELKRLRSTGKKEVCQVQRYINTTKANICYIINFGQYDTVDIKTVSREEDNNSSDCT